MYGIAGVIKFQIDSIGIEFSLFSALPFSSRSQWHGSFAETFVWPFSLPHSFPHGIGSIFQWARTHKIHNQMETLAHRDTIFTHVHITENYNQRRRCWRN